MIGMRWVVRSAGLISTVILARILTPQDFGLVAMSSLVLGLLTTSFEMGTSQLLLRTGETRREAYDTAWTIGLIQGVVLALAVTFASYPAALYYSEPRHVGVMQVVALGSVITGFSNIGIVMYRRDLEFNKDFLIGFYAKVVTVIPTVTLALYLRSYWALVIGPIVGNLIGVAISYLMHPFRPRPCLAQWRRFVVFSMWVAPSGIALYLSKKVDVFIVGFIANTSQLGIYNVASELSRMATAEVVIPMSRALLPNYAKLKDDLQALTAAFLLVVRTTSIIGFSFGFGVASVADDLVYMILGSQWAFAGTLVSWLGISGAFVALISILSGHILVVRGRERTMFFINCIKLAVLGCVLILASKAGDILTIAVVGTVTLGLVTVACTLYLPKVLPISAGRLLRELVSIFLFGWIMFITVKALHMEHLEWRAVRLLMDVMVGATVFVALLGMEWNLSGRPDGPERRVLGIIEVLLRRLVPR